MTFKQRLPYFLGGFIIGIIVVIFILDKKDTTFAYGPNARVLKDISTKKHVYSENILGLINSQSIDTATVVTILKNGNVDLWNKVKTDSCIIYHIRGRASLKNTSLMVTNCDSIAYIDKITVD